MTQFSRRSALKLLGANPDLGGIIAFGSQGPVGAAKTVEDAGKIDTVAVVGPSSPGQGAAYIKTGSIREGFTWNRMTAGRTIVRVGKIVADCGAITDGVELPDIGKVSVNTETRNVLAQKLQAINKDTIDELAGMGF